MYDAGDTRTGPIEPGEFPVEIELKFPTRRQSGRSAAFYRRQVQRYQELLDAVERYPSSDPCTDGQGLRIQMDGCDGKEYTYLAVRINGVYFLTGRAIHPMRWGELVSWMGADATSVHRVEIGEQLV